MPCCEVFQENWISSPSGMDSEYWENYYSRALQRRGLLRGEDCYCTAEVLMQLLPDLGGEQPDHGWFGNCYIR